MFFPGSLHVREIELAASYETKRSVEGQGRSPPACVRGHLQQAAFHPLSPSPPTHASHRKRCPGGQQGIGHVQNGQHILRKKLATARETLQLRDPLPSSRNLRQPVHVKQTLVLSGHPNGRKRSPSPQNRRTTSIVHRGSIAGPSRVHRESIDSGLNGLSTEQNPGA